MFIEKDPEWRGFNPVGLPIGGEGLPPEVLNGDLVIVRTMPPPDDQIPNGTLAVVVITVTPGRELTIVRRVHWRAGRAIVVLPGATPAATPIVLPRMKVKLLLPVLELRRRFEQADRPWEFGSRTN